MHSLSPYNFRSLAEMGEWIFLGGGINHAKMVSLQDLFMLLKH